MRLAYRFECHQHVDVLLALCHVSKNLYNQALYEYKQVKDNRGVYLSYYDLNKLMPTITNLEGTVNYHLLKAQVAQQTLQSLMRTIKSFYKSISEWKKSPSKFTGKPEFPKFLKYNSHYPVTYTNQCCSIRDGKIRLSKELVLDVPQWDEYKEKLERFQQVRIVPKNGFVNVEVLYESDEPNALLDVNRCASIDLGVSNLVTMVTDFCEPIIYSGKQLKAKNQWFNKELARLKSATERCNGKKSSKRIRRMYDNRQRQMDDALHKISRHIVSQLVKNGVGHLVLGHNKGWKDSINLGKVTNQNFTEIPYDRLISMLRYKCECCGIRFEETEESHTSKCDALAFEEIGHHDTYLGKRKKRGLFQSSTGRLINADVNGALNIMRKVVGDSPAVRAIVDSGRLFRPRKVNDIYSLSEIDFINFNEI